MTTIVTKNGSGAPLASDLVQGELAVDLTNKRLYTEDSGGTVIEVGTSPSTIDINAGTIDGTVIGGASAAAGTFTTFTSTGIDDNATSTAITIDSSQNVGIGTNSPAAPLAVEKTASAAQATALILRNASGLTGAETSIDFEASSGSSGLEASMAGRISGLRLGNGTTGALTFSTTSSGVLSERMRIDSSGNVGIGVTPSAWDSVFKNIQIGGNGYSGSFYSQANGDIADGIVLNAYYNGGWKYTASSKTATQYEQNNGIHKWAVAPSGTAGNAISWSEAMRIDSSGNLLVGATSPIATERLLVKSASGSDVAGSFYRPTTGTTSTVVNFRSNVGGTETVNCVIRSDGDLENTNNSYGAISDARLKSDIVDASSQIDDIMAVQVRSYTLNATGDTHIGVVAQELEASGMSGLVQENEDGMKSVKYSVMYMKAIKALQEAVTRIETLEAEVAALKGA